jgi:hypothetical protein
MASWWSVYLLIDYYEENASETLFTYPVSFFYHGLLRVLSFLFIFMILLTILLTIISFNHEDMVLRESIIYYIPQCMVYAAFGFLIMVATKNIIVPILLIAGYIAAKFFTQGDSIFPIYNIMFFQVDSLLLKDIVLKSGINISLSIILFLVGHYILSRKQKV